MMRSEVHISRHTDMRETERERESGEEKEGDERERQRMRSRGDMRTAGMLVFVNK